MTRPDDADIHRAIFERCPGLRCAVSAGGSLIGINESFERALGAGSGELLDQPIVDFIHADDRAAFEAAQRLARSGGSSAPFKGRARRRDGSLIFLEWIAFADPESGVVFASAQEIEGGPDELRRLRALVDAAPSFNREMVAKVKGSAEHNRLRALAETTPDLVATAGFDGRATYVNPAGLAMLGRVGQDVRELRLSSVIPRDWKARFKEMIFPTVIATGLWAGDTELLRADGTTFPVSQVVLLIRDEAGNAQGFGTIARDLTEERALERELERSARALSTPILHVWRGVLALPVTGHVDRERAALMTEALLHAIVRSRARVAILDLTGVGKADAHAVGNLIAMASAAALLGSQCVLSGITSDVARTIADLDVDVSSIPVFGTLEEALLSATRGQSDELQRVL